VQAGTLVVMNPPVLDLSASTNLSLALGVDWSLTNAVTTNLVSMKIPVITNGSTVYYLLLFTDQE